MRKKKILIAVAIILAVATVLGYLFVEYALRPTLIEMGEAKLKNMGTTILNSAITQTLAGYSSSEDFLHIEKDANGRVSLLAPDSIAINNIAAETTLTASAQLDELANTKFDIPIAGALGINILTNSGPYVHVILDNTGSVEASFTTEFAESGINQTHYIVHLTVTANMSMLVGTRPHEVTASADAVIAESIIVGDVPQTYANLPQTDEFLNLLP